MGFLQDFFWAVGVDRQQVSSVCPEGVVHGLGSGAQTQDAPALDPGLANADAYNAVRGGHRRTDDGAGRRFPAQGKRAVGKGRRRGILGDGPLPPKVS